MPSNPASPKPSNPDTPRGIQASKHPSILDCRNPLFDHLKGVTDPSRRGPQGISRRQTLCPPTPPLAPKLALPPARECQMAHLTGNRHPSIQASEHPGIQASIPPARGCQMGHLTGNRHPSSQASEHPGIQASMPQVQRSAAEAVAYKSGRGLEGRAHQAARRRPRSGAEAGIKVTSNQCLVSNLN